MKRKYLLMLGMGLLAMLTLTSATSGDDVPKPKLPVYLNTSYSFEERAVDLVSRLTLEEKESLLGNNMAAIPRLGVKQYNVWSEALHGVLSGAVPAAGIQGPTSFPNSVALGSSWDPELMQMEANAIVDEARAIFNTGSKGLTFWSPVVEPIRDPRWGRTGESFGEDPFLVSEMGIAFVKGFTGDDPYYLKAVPTAKHYFANNSEFDRHVSSSNMDSRDMREFYLSPYKYLIEDADLPSIMSSYNAVNGVPTSASKMYLDTIARRTYGMDGYVTGDCAAIEDIYTGHYYVETGEEATAAGLIAGVDSDCGSVYQRFAISALEQGLMTMDDIDRALVNVFKIRMRTGEFDPASRVPFSMYQPNVVNSPANQALAKEVATRTAVLLKNEPGNGRSQILPLDPSSLKRIALIGPQANDVELGPYSGRPEKTSMISPYDGLTKYIADRGLSTEVVLAEGGNIVSKSNLLYIVEFKLQKADGTETVHDATKYSASSPGITVGSGMGTVEQVRSIDDGSWTCYENVDLTDVESMGINLNIPTVGGLVEVRVGSPEGNLLVTLDATVASGNRAGGVYGAGEYMYTKINKLGLNEPQTLYFVYKAAEDPNIDPAIIETARNSDVAVVFVGTDENTATEEADRLTLLLPGNQVKLIKAVAEVNPNTIVVMQTLGCVEVEEFKHLVNIPGILWTGYNGQAQGAAIAEVLFGDVTPGGKLNGTWYKSVNDLPAITDYTLRGGEGKNGRTFWYFKNDVSYEFGYGISYTTFEYSNFKISRSQITPNDKITVSVDVTNTGKYDGDEVVQIYMTTPDSPASLERPIKRLKGFKRVSIPIGQTKTVSIDIDCADLWFWDMEADKMTYDQGRYVFEIGSSSKDIRGTVTAVMKGQLKPELKVVVADCGSQIVRSGFTSKISFTAAMTDDSFYDVNKASVVYTSSNPSVLSVDKDGNITAKGTGLATITVDVTIDGKTVSDSFAMKVMPDMSLASLKVDGKSVKGFTPEVAQYSYIKNAGAKVPVVEAVAADPAISVAVEQAESVPGSAVVTLTDYVTLEHRTYSVLFGTKAKGDEFKTLGPQWSWVRENPANWSLKNGAVAITSAKGALADDNNDAENILLTDANSDWTASTKLMCSRKPSGMAQNAGMVAYQDDDNYIKLAYTASMGRRGPDTESAGAIELSIEENGNRKAVATVRLEKALADNSLVFKLVKKGDTYTASYSEDGKKFVEVGVVKAVLNDVKAGVMVCEGAAPAMMRRFAAAAPAQQDTTPFEVAFDYFRLTPTGLK